MAAFLLVVPLASATWFTRGTYEPDTLCDTAAGCTTPGGLPVAGGYMYQSADTSASGQKIYFNGFIVTGGVVGTVNPNSEMLGTRFTTSKGLEAYLGVWKDCNNDGYIGAAFGALHTYRSEAGALTSICPDGSQFNRNGWVYEFIWIGAGGQRAGDRNYPSEDDQRWINDTASKVWIDFGLPGTAAAPTCPIQPWPSGTTGSTGGLLMNFDCFITYRAANTVNGLDPDGSLGLRFDDPAAPQKSDSLLNQDFPVHPWHDPYGGPGNNENDTGFWDENSQRDWSDRDNWDGVNDEEDTAFTVWDCSQPSATTVDDPTGTSPDGALVRVAGVSPSVDDPIGGSYYDSVNHTERGAHNPLSGGGTRLLSYDGQLGRAEGEDGSGTVSNNCDRQRTTWGQDQLCGEAAPDSPNPRRFTTTWCLVGIEGFGVVGFEAEFLASGFKPRRESSDVMNFNTGGQPPRGGQLPSSVNDPRNGNPLVNQDLDSDLKNATGMDSGDALNTTLGKGYQYGPDIWGSVILRPGWSGQIGWVRANCCVLISTDTLQPHGAQWLTYYASIGSATTATGAVTPKNNAAGIYGAEWCKGATSGVSTSPPGLDCDATHWWNPAFGATAMFTANGFELGARVGDAYHLRDVDCYDSTVLRGSGIRASLVELSADGPCVDAP